ncbi:MAG: tRNA (adenosine(37)-N6)-threonylcarbamoyltransferase complex dimerization subunit type 1 TsaB [Pseudobdellovibrionaceae bacterium]
MTENATPTIVALDTALDGCHVGLLHKGETHFSLSPMQRGQSEELIPLVNALLKSADVTYADLDAVAVTKGPGSFTGTRIALAAAQSIALAQGIPLYGLTNFEAIAGHDTCTVAIDTKRGEAFVQEFAAGVSVTAPHILPYESCIEKLPKENLRTNISNLDGDEIDLKEMIGFLLSYAQKQYLDNDAKKTDEVKPTYLRDAETSQSKIKYRKISK